MQTFTPDAHTLSEWSRLATDAYRLGLNDAGHRFSVGSAMSGPMPLATYDAMMTEYREWLIAGFPGYAHETLHARGLLAMKIKYERVYYADVREAEPTPEVRHGAERQIPFLHPSREQVLYTTQGMHFRRQLLTSDGWRLTYTPEGN